MNITLSIAAIRAQIQSLVALKATLDSTERPILDSDNNFALNQHIIKHFLWALMKMESAVVDYSISPDNYMDDPLAEVMLSVELISGYRSPGARLVRGHLENYIADAVLADIFASGTPFESRIHENRAEKALALLVESIIPPEVGGMRISRTI